MAFKLDLRGAWTFWAATALAGFSLLLVIVNGVLARSIESARLEVNQRQLTINELSREARQNQDLAQMLAIAAARNNNTAIRDLLARNGITFVVNQPAPPAADGSSASTTPANPPLRKP